MSSNHFKSNLRLNALNIPGWVTRRKIIVIESDDWGSIRMSSTTAFNDLKKAGIPVQMSHYNLYDSLECNTDLEMLTEVLRKFKDKSDRHPVITGVNIVANPDFEAIKANGFTKFEYEPFSDTLKKYPEHDQVLSMWQSANAQRLLVPVFHGREHLHVARWMKALQTQNKTTHLAFQYQITGLPIQGMEHEIVPDFQAAFDIDHPNDIINLKEIIASGLNLFENLYGFRTSYFVPTNGPFNNQLEIDLKNAGILYINTAKIQREPLGEGKFKTNFRYLGKINAHNQCYITRNCFFEPAASGFEKPADTDWIGHCLKEIETAFRWYKPAIISTHRVNYAGYLSPKNRDAGLNQLQQLLSIILKKWPEVEFLTSVELGNCIASEKRIK